ncbi:CPBP family intramembrane glutamic endopeptidase [Romboutsia lituseburensis]|uniref:CPBP family intramembrane glutamic endopeptidase n=1 Tax=Romboutsia lituseburensis TaxID=1537 RepID=UPI00215A5EE7|nr:CPBP family intramembrane metalloprotease [Romboutsia lituseburensis]MCR8743741.1 CPBP family intramembrane metalloprotease [Romboutsia lituseburensis]
MFTRNVSLVDEAKKSKKLPNIIWGIILLLIFMYGGNFIGQLILLPFLLAFNNSEFFILNQEPIILMVSLVLFAFSSLLVFFRVKVIEKRKISSIGFAKDAWLRKYLIGFLIGIIMMGIIVLILYGFGYITIDKNPIQPVGISSLPVILIFLVGWIIQGGTEEILTRGWLMNVLGARYNIVLGLIISSLLFSFMHLLNPNVNYIAVINIALVGLFYGLCVIKTNDLWAVCGMHSAWNFAQGNLFGFEVSGNNVPVGSLMDFKLIGSDFVTGGPFGPEAGIVSTIILVASILILLLLDKKGCFKKSSIL